MAGRTGLRHMEQQRQPFYNNWWRLTCSWQKWRDSRGHRMLHGDTSSRPTGCTGWHRCCSEATSKRAVEIVTLMRSHSCTGSYGEIVEVLHTCLELSSATKPSWTECFESHPVGNSRYDRKLHEWLPFEYPIPEEETFQFNMRALVLSVTLSFQPLTHLGVNDIPVLRLHTTGFNVRDVGIVPICCQSPHSRFNRKASGYGL
jgi:hypothetical protein